MILIYFLLSRTLVTEVKNYITNFVANDTFLHGIQIISNRRSTFRQ